MSPPSAHPRPSGGRNAPVAQLPREGVAERIRACPRPPSPPSSVSLLSRPRRLDPNTCLAAPMRITYGPHPSAPDHALPANPCQTHPARDHAPSSLAPFP
ncbi:hypothetical protein GGF50DRAFT_121661 [Schizophyllum commune]